MALQSEKLRNDARVQQAKDLLVAALRDAQKEITQVRPADESLKIVYAQWLERCGTARGANTYYKYLGSGLGHGPLVELADASVKYDFITGIGAHYFGHSNEAIMLSGVNAALADTVMQGHLQQNCDQVLLMESFLNLAKKNGAPLDHCFLTSSGATANENTLKILFQKNHPANRMLAFSKCFAGRTLALAQMTDKAAYRDGIPLGMEVDYLPFYDETDHQGSIDQAVQTLNSHLVRFPEAYAGMCFELIQGEGGYFPGNRQFFVEIIKVLQANNIAVWIDEIQTFGRTDEAFAFQHFALDEFVDVVTVGKMSQVCATLFRAAFKPRPGLVSQTFTSSTAAIRASLVILEELRHGGLCGKNGKIVKLHNCFKEEMKKLARKFPGQFIGPYGMGGMCAFTVFDGDFAKAKAFAARLFEAGVISFIAGKSPTRIRFLLPVMDTEEKHIQEVCSLVEEVMKDYSEGD